MIGRKRAVLRRERGAAEIRKLVGMQLDRKAEALGRIEDARGLVPIEGDPFAERVDRIDQLLGCRGGQHLVADEIDVIVGAPFIFLRHSVSAQERRSND